MTIKRIFALLIGVGTIIGHAAMQAEKPTVRRGRLLVIDAEKIDNSRKDASGYTTGESIKISLKPGVKLTLLDSWGSAILDPVTRKYTVKKDSKKVGRGKWEYGSRSAPSSLIITKGRNRIDVTDGRKNYSVNCLHTGAHAVCPVPFTITKNDSFSQGYAASIATSNITPPIDDITITHHSSKNPSTTNFLATLYHGAPRAAEPPAPGFEPGAAGAEESPTQPTMTRVSRKSTGVGITCGGPNECYSQGWLNREAGKSPAVELILPEVTGGRPSAAPPTPAQDFGVAEPVDTGDGMSEDDIIALIMRILAGKG